MGNKVSVCGKGTNSNNGKRKNKLKKSLESSLPQICDDYNTNTNHESLNVATDTGCQTSPSLGKKTDHSVPCATSGGDTPSHKPPRHPATASVAITTPSSSSNKSYIPTPRSHTSATITSKSSKAHTKPVNGAEGDIQGSKVTQVETDSGVFHRKNIYVPQDEKSMMLFISNRGRIIKNIMQKTYTTIKLSSVAISCTGKERLKLGSSQKREILIEGYHRTDVQKALRCIAEYLTVIDSSA